MAWIGSPDKKGLAVFSLGEYEVSLMAQYDERLQWIAPISVTGPACFSLLAVWGMNGRGSQSHPIHRERWPFLQALDVYRLPMGSGSWVVAGDFNNSTSMDKPKRPHNHSLAVTELDKMGLKSSYHVFHEAQQGIEPDPTFWYATTKTPYHIDFCFIPKQWVRRIQTVAVGNLSEYAESKLSDHAPITVDLALSH
jgi:endonuclease/exonuclease/phosphatase family metal-dependent hydrolase